MSTKSAVIIFLYGLVVAAAILIASATVSSKYVLPVLETTNASRAR